MYLLLVVFFWKQEFYYVDGTTLELENGTLIKTAEDVKEDLFNYYWYEEGTYIAVEKRRIKSIGYFSLRVKGRQPPKPFKSAVQRRIEGHRAAYLIDGVTHLRVRHVDERGHTTEGKGSQNLIKDLQAPSADPAGEGERKLAATLLRTEPKTILELRFYSLEGRLLFRSFTDMDTAPTTKARRGAETLEIGIVKDLDLEKVGLVEAITIRK